MRHLRVARFALPLFLHHDYSGKERGSPGEGIKFYYHSLPSNADRTVQDD
jgi:hypothetical protein